MIFKYKTKYGRGVYECPVCGVNQETTLSLGRNNHTCGVECGRLRNKYFASVPISITSYKKALTRQELWVRYGINKVLAN